MASVKQARASRFVEVDVDGPMKLWYMANAAAKAGRPIPGHWPGAFPHLEEKKKKASEKPLKVAKELSWQELLYEAWCLAFTYIALAFLQLLDAFKHRDFFSTLSTPLTNLSNPVSTSYDALMHSHELPTIKAPSLKPSLRRLVVLVPLLGFVGVQAQNSATDYCTRWSHQSAVINGTIYVYGGRASQTSGQTDNTWNNDFLTLDVTKTWTLGSPTLKSIDKPSGPPAVANGYLWHSYSSLFLYGGEYSDHPVTSPSPYAMWEYDIGSSSWSEHSNPKTSAGNSSDGGNQPVQNAAEGAGLSVPLLGRGFYFGGHLDGYTTPGWSQSTERVYVSFIPSTLLFLLLTNRSSDP